MSQGATTTSAQAVGVHALGVELPVDLAQALESYVAQRPGLDPARLLQTALAQFLVQHGGARPEVRELYLDGLFGTGL
ncbi:DUF2811 domain-containing protein [Synechococcus sp. LA31]|jgi:hypothetical protein|uniref:DUF2811 domain-containing protein n=1 Tax=Synechococcus sp. LA31 TaxID=2741953 RepID=UPI001BDCDF97|nr:DUF2811 domain-containing protein [Synechococcus sp. LA31]QVV68386.1 DUF2811 domain-containing protein [Synechococcus sp. LA31]